MLRAVAIFSLAAAASATTVDPSAGSVSLAAGSATLAISSAGELFTLSRVASDGTATRAGRSYDGHGWEGAQPEALSFDCSASDGACSAWLPGGDEGATYLVEARSARALSDAEAASRFLARASFGPTRASVRNLTEAAAALAGGVDAAMGVWARAQVEEAGVTSHRAYYRKRSNPRVPQAVVVGGARGACEPGSRWHRHAFSRADTGKTLDAAYVDGVWTLSLDGVARTEVAAFNASARLAPFVVCDGVGESIGGDVPYGAGCAGLLANPAIAFASGTPPAGALSASLAPLTSLGRYTADAAPFSSNVALLAATPAGCDPDGSRGATPSPGSASARSARAVAAASVALAVGGECRRVQSRT